MMMMTTTTTTTTMTIMMMRVRKSFKNEQEHERLLWLSAYGEKGEYIGKPFIFNNIGYNTKLRVYGRNINLDGGSTTVSGAI